MFAVTVPNSTGRANRETPTRISPPRRRKSAYLKHVLDELHHNRQPISWSEFARRDAERLRGEAPRHPTQIRQVA
jgi:hypothetical protein